MFNKKMKRFLAVALCGMMTIAAVPMLSVKAEEAGDDAASTEALCCEELATTTMAENDIWPNTAVVENSLSGGWFRELEETEDGLRIKYAKAMHGFSHCTSEMISVDGAHMQITFNVKADENDTTNTCDPSKTIGLTFGWNDTLKPSNNPSKGIYFKLQVQTGQLYCFIDGTPIDHSKYEGYTPTIATDRIFIPEDQFDRTATTLDIKTSVTDDGDFLFNVNGYEFTVAKADWEKSAGYAEDYNMYIKVGTDNKTLDCTWNFLHNDNDHVDVDEWMNDEENHWKTCLCGVSENELEAHTPETVNAKDATVEEEGYTGDTVCSVCGYEIAKGETIEKLTEDTNTGSDNTGNAGTNNTTNTGTNNTTNTGSSNTTNTGSNNTTNTGSTNKVNTGDNTSVALYLIAMLVGCAGVVTSVVYNKKRTK